MDSYDTWHIFYDYDKEDVDVDEEPEHKHDEYSSSMNISSSEDSPSSGEDTLKSRRILNGTPTGIEIPRRSTRQTQPPVRFRGYALMTQVINVEEPLTFEQAKDKKEWMDAMTEDYNSIIKNDTWELTKLTKDKVSIGSKCCSSPNSRLMVAYRNMKID